MILVTGATGNVGREVVNLLLEDGQEVAAVTRNSAAAALPGGANVVAGDPSHPKTLTSSALRGVEAVLISPRALGDTTAGAVTAELLDLAAEQGAERAVALSAVTVQYPAGYRRFADAFKAVEEAVKASRLPWTLLRQPDQVTDSLHAYQLAKRGNSLRVMAEAMRWGERGARVNAISPGIVMTPLAKDELGLRRAAQGIDV